MNGKRVVFLTLLFTVLIFSISAFAQTTSPVITVDSVSGVAGAMVDVEVALENNVGILGAELTLSYDEHLTLKEFSSGNAFSMLTFTPPGSSDSPCTFIWDGENLSEDDIKNGAVLKLRFEISDDALPGDIYNICISCDDGQMRDYDLNVITPDIVDGAVSIVDYMPGDLNGDTGVDVADVIMLRRHLAGGYMQTINTYAIDVNADEDITISDLILLRRYLAGGYDVELLPGTNSQISSLTIWSDDVKSYSLNKLEYYLDPVNSSKTAEINVNLKQINYNSKVYTDNIDDKLSDIIQTYDVELYFTDNDEDEIYDELTATKYVSDVIKSVDVINNVIQLRTNGNIKFDLDKTVIFENESGRKLSISDFSKNDVVAIVSDNLSGDSYDEFIKVILLSDSVVTGVIDETYCSNDYEYVVINERAYICNLSKPLGVADKGTFYVGKTGKIIDVTFDINYGYFLEATLSETSFSANTWQVKLLTPDNGVVVYEVTDDVNVEFEQYFYEYFSDESGIVYGKWIYEFSTMKDAPHRLITYELNSKKQIKNFAVADGVAIQLECDINGVPVCQYDKASKTIGGRVLEDDVIIFNVTSGDADDTFTTNISSLFDNSAYAGFIYANEDAENCVMVISADDGTWFDCDDGFAIATKVSSSKDAADNDIIRVNYVRNEEEGTIIFDEDSESSAGSASLESLEVGDVFLFNANTECRVSNYIILAKFDEGTEKLLLDEEAITAVQDNSNVTSDVEFEYGYIESFTKRSGRDYLTIVDDRGYEDVVSEPVVITANKYTYCIAGRNAVIEVGDFMADDVDEMYTNSDGETLVYYVFIRYVDGDVADIYSISYGHSINSPNSGGSSGNGGSTTVKPSTGGGSGGSGSSGNSGNTGNSGSDDNQDSGDGGNQGTPDTPTDTTYTITYNLNNETLSGQKTTYKASDADYTLPTPTKNGGYKFFGWYETAEFDGKPVTVLASGSIGDKTYYAKWGYLYSIEYVLTPATYGEGISEDKKGKIDGTEKKKYTEFDEDYELPTPYRDDGTPFIGWYVANEDEKFKGALAISVSDEYHVTTIPAGSTGMKTYYAVWEDMQVDSEAIYAQIDNVDWDLESNIEGITELINASEVFTTDSADSALFIVNTMYQAIDEVFNWQSDNVLVNNSLVRQVYKEEADKMRQAIDSFTSEEKVEFETIFGLRLSKNTMDILVDIFNININYGK